LVSPKLNAVECRRGKLFQPLGFHYRQQPNDELPL
jgi:hypothetical protein